MKYYADFVAEEFGDCRRMINGRWHVMKPESPWNFERFREAWDVFTGKAYPIYFQEAQ